MAIRIREITRSDNLNNVIPILQEWHKESHTDEYGMTNSPEEAFKSLIADCQNVLIAEDEDSGQWVGFMGIKYGKHPYSQTMMLSEHFWFSLPEYRGNTGRKFIKELEKLAKKINCKHVVLNANYISSDKAERLMKFYEIMGYKKIAVAYMKEVQ